MENASDIRVRRSYDFMSKRAGGVECAGFIEFEHKKFLRTKGQREFMYVDAKMRINYRLFGDVFAFDTTYSTNKKLGHLEFSSDLIIIY
uniref:Uncharacterized protein n=1 Tax=Kalanchoe fedtschenkoi TaxID=63787 RepID=A0A7N0UNL8_KALFE